MITVALFAISAAIAEGSFVYDYGISTDAAQVLGGTSHDLHGSDFAGGPLFLSREANSEAALLTRRPSQQALSRTLRNGNFQGFCGRDTGTLKRATTLAGNCTAAQAHTHRGFPTPLAYQTSKEYYVFTLERILC